MSWEIREGHVLDRLREMPDDSVQTCVTSPPYWGLRDYGLPPSTWGDGWVGQLGLEPTPGQYVVHIAEIFREVRRVLREDGTLWLNLGDSYAGSWGAQSRGGAPSEASTLRGNGHVGGGPKAKSLSSVQIAAHPKGQTNTGTIRQEGLKPKDLIGIPWEAAFALRMDGWWLRSENIWAKPNPMPESVQDRTTRSHESLFMLSKAPRYFYDAKAIKEGDGGKPSGNSFITGLAKGGSSEPWEPGGGRNKRDVWTVATQAFPDAHFAVFPPKLIEPCVLAGCPEGGTVLDPFAGAGTTLMVAERLGRDSIGIELNPEYVELARQRIIADCPLHNTAAEAAA